MKKLFGIILVVAMALSAMAFAQDKHVIGVSIPAADHGWTAGVVYWANQAKAQVEQAYPNLTVIVKTAKDSAEQANQIQDLVTVNKIEALVILPYESAPLTKPVADVKAQGVFVVVVDRGLTDPSIQDVYVAGDNPGMGRVSGEYVADKLGGKGQIVVLRGIPTVIDNQRFDAFMEVMKQYPDITVLDAQYANWNRDDGFKVMQDFLTRFPQIDAVWAQDDDIAVGVLRAIQQANRSDIQFVLGGAGMKEFIKKVMDGDPMVPADVLYPPNMVNTAVNVAALHYTSGAAVLGTYIVGAPLVTQDNAAQYYFPDSPF